MDKLTIPGDPRLEETIRREAGRLPGQAFIFSGPGDRAAAALFLAAALQCRGEDRPCGACGPCRKVLAGIHPDVTVVRDPDHKNLSMDVLRQVRQDAYLLPNEGAAKVYLFPDCGLLEPKTQNVLLKVLEEGPPYAVFLFCAESAAQLLPTVRSRCVEWTVRGPEAQTEADPRAAREPSRPDCLFHRPGNGEGEAGGAAGGAGGRQAAIDGGSPLPQRLRRQRRPRRPAHPPPAEPGSRHPGRGGAAAALQSQSGPCVRRRLRRSGPLHSPVRGE